MSRIYYNIPTHNLYFYDPETALTQEVHIITSTFHLDAIMTSRTAIIPLLKSTAVQQSTPLDTFRQGILQGVIDTHSDYINLMKCYHSNIHKIPYNQLFPTHFYPLKQEYFILETPEDAKYECTFRSTIEVTQVKDKESLIWEVVLPIYAKRIETEGVEE